jgi:hypothetical protein
VQCIYAQQIKNLIRAVQIHCSPNFKACKSRLFEFLIHRRLGAWRLIGMDKPSKNDPQDERECQKYSFQGVIPLLLKDSSWSN